MTVAESWSNNVLDQWWMNGVGRCWNDLADMSRRDVKASGHKFGEINLVVK